MYPAAAFFNFRTISRIVIGTWFMLVFSGCEKKNKHARGKVLAEKYCASCHLFPDADLLTRKVWSEMVLPNMGLKMGISHGPIYSYGNPDSLQLQPTLSQVDWNNIVYYYLNESKNNLVKELTEVLQESDVFESEIYTYDSLPLVTMINFDHEEKRIRIGDGRTSKVLKFDINGNFLGSEKSVSPMVKVVHKNNLEYQLTIGKLNPSDKAMGQLSIENDTISQLIRPVDFLVDDINQDGFDDVYVCNYGNNIGDFSWYENKKDGNYQKNLIIQKSGAIKIEKVNMDGDPEEEVIVLFAQEHESLVIFDLESVGEFKPNQVLQFQPAFGSVDFSLKDVNNDGLKDIIIANGDNSDLSTILKPFHGVRIFINQGKKLFEEAFFYPMHGVSKIISEDFDTDGDYDILAISNFGDFDEPSFKSVRFLENKGSMKFEPYSIKGLPDYRWQTIEMKDFDNDGDQDVYIGSFDFDAGPKESDISAKKHISWVRLENKTN